MEPKQDAWSVVVTGHWNRMIFMPAWVGKNVFGADEIEKLVPILPIAPLIYRTDEISLAVENRRLVLGARHQTRECMKKAAEMAVGVLRKLDDTPVSAIGVNFGFLENAPGDLLLKRFNLADDTEIGVLGWDIGSRNLVRRLHKEGKTMNLTLGYDGATVEMDINFHYDVESAEEAAAAVEGQVDVLHDECVKLIQDVYDLKVKERTVS